MEHDDDADRYIEIGVPKTSGVNVREAARRVGKSPSTIQREISLGRLPTTEVLRYKLVGRERRIADAALEAYRKRINDAEVAS